MAAYQSIAGVFYRGFQVPQGFGMNHLLPEELAHYALFTLFGTAAAVLLAVALRGLPLCDRLGAALRALCERPLAPPLLAAALVLASGLGLGSFVLGHAVISDDEHTYRFIAQTLRSGALVAPSPGGDLEFFREQFVALDAHVRFGKYPIGHPLLLAAGQALGVEVLVVPLLAALVAFPLHAFARATCGPLVAGLACLLYAASPQVWFTSATYLSQPASALALMAALALLVRLGPDPVPDWRLAAAGACLGFGVLVRPLPGVLFAAVAAVDVLLLPGASATRRAARFAVFALPLTALAAGVAIVNHFQTGAALVSGYQAAHPDAGNLAGLMGGGFAARSMSVAAALVRECFWLFGWPLSLVPCLFAGRVPRPWLSWGVLGAELAYRLAAPKAGVGGAGPLYLFEAVPLLCLLAALGVVRLARGEAAPRAGALRGSLTPALLALTAVALAMFVPPKLRDLRRMGAAQLEVERQLRARGVGRAVVFHEGVVPPWTGMSWAYFPRNNAPGLDDDVLYLRLQRAGGLGRNLELARRRFPGRTAWYFGWDRTSGPFLADLDTFVHMHEGRAPGDPALGADAVRETP
jgi:hypothetical protein